MWLSLGVAVLGSVEAFVGHLLISLLPTPVDIALDAVLVVGTGFTVLAFASPLWSTHRLTPDEARLHFGWLAAVRVSRREVIAVRPYEPPRLEPVQLGVTYDPDRGRLVLARSGASPAVRVDLARPVTGRWMHRRVLVRSVVVTTHDAAMLLAWAP